MKTLNLTFDDKEFEILNKFKKKSKSKSWKKFFMQLISDRDFLENLS